MPVSRLNENTLTTRDLLNLAMQMQQMKLAADRLAEDKKTHQLSREYQQEQMAHMRYLREQQQREQQRQEEQRTALGQFLSSHIPEPMIKAQENGSETFTEPTESNESPEEQKSRFDKIYKKYKEEKERRESIINLGTTGAFPQLPTSIQEAILGLEKPDSQKTVYEQKQAFINELVAKGVIPQNKADELSLMLAVGAGAGPTQTARAAEELTQIQQQIEDAMIKKQPIDPRLLATYYNRKDADPYFILSMLSYQFEMDPNMSPALVRKLEDLDKELQRKTIEFKTFTVTNDDGTSTTEVYSLYDLAKYRKNAVPLLTISGELSWRPNVQGEQQSDWILGHHTLNNLAFIRDLYQKYGSENFTYLMRIKADMMEFANRLGLKTEDEAKRQWKMHRDMLWQALEQSFQAWRKVVTGPQAQPKELQDLRRMFLNGDLSGDRLESFFATIVLQTLRKMINIENIQPPIIPPEARYTGVFSDGVFLGKSIDGVPQSPRAVFAMLYPNTEIPESKGRERPEYDDPGNDPNNAALGELMDMIGGRR